MEQDSKIFISYRREDSSGYAGRLHDALSSRFGPDRVFMDVDSIEYGVDFVEVVENAVGSCAVLIAIIGKRWVEITDKKGNRRLDNPQDFVHLEIAAALKRNIRIIPALVQDAVMPGEDVLPAPLAKLARRNAIEMSDTRWKFDVERLIETLDEELNKNSTAPIKQSEAKESPNAPAGRSDKNSKVKTETVVASNKFGWLKIAAIALCVLALAGLSWKIISKFTGNNKTDAQQNTQSSGKTPVPANGGTDPNAADEKHYEGLINGRERISLKLRRQNQFLSGSISNFSTRRFNIQIKGSIDSAQNIVLQELDNEGVETGIYRGKLSSDMIQGTWTDPQGKEQVPFYLREVHD